MTEFIAPNVWERLSATAKECTAPAFVAVAYFGKGAADLLPLSAGSRLVVDASDHSIKSGQTHPADLKRLLNKGVRVFSFGSLHAKVYVFDTIAFIGSANASNNSASSLKEAVLATSDAKIVRESREFVRSLCLQELGPKELDDLQTIYRPPLINPDHARAKRQAAATAYGSIPRVRIVQLGLGTLPDEAEETEKEGVVRAKRVMEQPTTHVLEHFWWGGKCPYQKGQTLLRVLTEGGGRVLVSPPARVIHTEVWKGEKRTINFVYVEHRKQKRVSLTRLAKKLGYGWKKRLQCKLLLNSERSAQLLHAWS